MTNPLAIGDLASMDAHKTWTGRKTTALRRPTLDCGCPSTGEVFFHLWCDRLACQEHAEAEHDCSQFKGVVEVQPEAQPEPSDAWVASRARIDEMVARALADASESGGSAPIRRPAGCTCPPDMDPAEYSVLCGPCSEFARSLLPPGDRVADAFRAEVRRQGLAPCEIEIDGRTEWLTTATVTVDSQVEAFRQEETLWADPVAAPVDAALEPNPVDIRPDPRLHGHFDNDPYQCSPDCPMPAAPRPWWKRLLP